MPDDKSKRGAADRGKVAQSETYELGYFATKHGLSKDEARDLIKKVGNQRAALDKAADAVKRAKKR
jgi:hypothetical protein